MKQAQRSCYVTNTPQCGVGKLFIKQIYMNILLAKTVFHNKTLKSYFSLAHFLDKIGKYLYFVLENTKL